MFKTLACMLLVVSFSCACLAFKDCGSKGATVQVVDVIGCTTGRCIFHKGRNETVNFTFKSDVSTDNLKVITHGIIAHVPIPFPLPNSNACKDYGIKCPIASGETYTLVVTLPVLQSYPSVAVDIRLELRTDDDEDVICVELPVRIQ